MPPIKILAGIDFSDCSRRAAVYLVEMIKNQEFELVLNHSYSDFIDVKEFDADFKSEELQHKKEVIENTYLNRLSEFRETLEEQLLKNNNTNYQINIDLKHGYPEDQLVKIANVYHPDLIVMGSSVKSNSINELMGTVTSDLIRKTFAPVLSVPLLADTEFVEIRNILYLTDYHSSDFDSLHRLLKIMANQMVNVYCIHFCHSKPDKFDEMRIQDLQKYCDETYRNHKFFCELIIGEELVDSINQFITQKSINVIAVTRIRRNRITKFLHPDISKRLLFHTHIPIIVFNE